MPERPTGYLSAEELDALNQVSTATITTQLLNRGFRNTFMQDVRPVRPELRMLGYAFTLRYIPMREDLDIGASFDNLTNPQRIAVEQVGPGDVLVVDARGETGSGVLGDILITRIQRRGAAGVVTDGSYRDTPGVAEVGIPAYARGMHGTASSKLHHPVDINMPVGCGGVPVFPGDVIVGDAEGVVVIPHHLASEVAHGALAQERYEAWALAKIQAGASIIGTYPPDDATRAAYEAETGGRAGH
jgi:regulator of RNase E activity RraA